MSNSNKNEVSNLRPRCYNGYVRTDEDRTCWTCGELCKAKKKMRQWLAKLEGVQIVTAYVCKSCYHKYGAKLIEQKFKIETEKEMLRRAKA